jgi:hypothetical protein
MKIFIDFDDVIFNTGKFVINLRNFFQENGISEDLFRKYYYTEIENSEIKLFDPWNMFERLEREQGFDAKNIREKFSKQLADLESFVFPDVAEFLKKMGKQNIFLISFGLPVFQNEKIVGCGVDKLVNGCIVTRGSKAVAIEKTIQQLEIPNGEQLIFIDDRVEQVQEIKKRFPACCTMLLCRKEGRYCDAKNEYCDYEVHSLEAREIIKNIHK